jgi:hypothetical protein
MKKINFPVLRRAIDYIQDREIEIYCKKLAPILLRSFCTQTTLANTASDDLSDILCDYLVIGRAYTTNPQVFTIPKKQKISIIKRAGFYLTSKLDGIIANPISN